MTADPTEPPADQVSSADQRQTPPEDARAESDEKRSTELDAASPAPAAPESGGDPPLRRRIQIGARPLRIAPGLPSRKSRDQEAPQRAGTPSKEQKQEDAESPEKPAKPEMPEASAPVQTDEIPDLPETPRPRRKTPLPSGQESLPPDLEREIDEALGELAAAELPVATGPIELGEPLAIESRHRATVVKIHGDDVFFSLGGRNQGIVSLRQFREPPSIGSEMEVVVRAFHEEDGLYELTVPGATVEVQDWSDLVEGAVVEARITGSNTGGLECMVGNIRGFIPASQIEMYRVESYADYYDKKLLCVVTEANRRRRNLVLSHRAILEREREEQRKKRLEELEVGQVLEGVVTSIRDFGAFVDIGGIEGMVHVSQLSWDRIEHPSEVLEVGQKVRVKVEKIHRQTGKVGLTYRDLLEHPWTNVEQRFPVDSIVKGTVTRTAKFGAFVKLAPGVEGLVHISELAHHRVMQVTNVVNEGDEVEVKVLSVDPEAQRIALSLKEAHSAVEPDKATRVDDAADQAARQPAVPRRHHELKGGTDRSSGGEEFGLRW